MDAVQFSVAKSQFFDNNGDVLSLGSVEITYSLTALPAITYQNSAKTTVNDYPIALTAVGKADIYLNAGIYNIVTRNYDGVVVDTVEEYIVENVTENALAGNTPVGGIIMFSGIIADIPTGWHLCDGSEGTPTLQDRFIKGTVYQDDIGVTGGSADTIVVAHIHENAHTHQLAHTHDFGAHSHNMTHFHTMQHTHPSVHTHSSTMGMSGDHRHETQYYQEDFFSSASPMDIPNTSVTDSGTRAQTQLGGDHDHSLTIGAASANSGESSNPNTGASSTSTTGEFPTTATGMASEQETQDQLPEDTGSTGDSGVGANEPEFYTLAFIMRIE